MNGLLRVAMLARLAMLATGLALLASPILGPLVDPAAARGLGPLPACRYDDVLTTPRAYSDWSITLVDTILRVTSTYVPPDLVPVSDAGIAGSGQVRAFVIDDLRAMRQAAAAAGAAIGVESAYRSYADQLQVFDRWVKQFGYARALQVPARPGHSEHQLGTAIDFRSEPVVAIGAGTWGSTPAGKWMAAHAWEYGFVMSYPKGATAVTCYDYEPWHFRYVGRDLAASIHDSGLTTREFLWASFTTTVVPPPKGSPAVFGAPVVTPGASTPATTEPSPSPTVPTPTATAVPATPAQPTQAPLPAPVATALPIDPAVAAGALPVLVVVAAITFGAIGLGVWLVARRRRPGGGR